MIELSGLGRLLVGIFLASLVAGCSPAGGLGTSTPPPAPGSATPLAVPAPTVAPTQPALPAGSPVPAQSPAASPAPARPAVTPSPAAPASTAPPAPTKPAVGGTDTVLDRLVERARLDLTQRTGAMPGEISLVSATPQEWRDSSLGCPQPGGMYAQVITPGYRIVLEARGTRHQYHCDSSTRVIYCPNPSS